MIITFDANVIIDAIMERGKFKVAQELVLAAANEKIYGIVTANTITDIYYLTRKTAGDQGARRMIANVLSIFDVAVVDGEACAAALNVPMSDYEDAVLAVCAAREEADYIATGDQGFLKADSPVPARTPEELLSIIKEGF